MSRSLRTALLKLESNKELAASQFTPAQRKALDAFGQQTGALECIRRGSGYIYKISQPQLFATHLRAFAPETATPQANDIPQRAQHIAQTRSSKAGKHQHRYHYPIIKSIGPGVAWHNPARNMHLPLGQLTKDYGATTIQIDVQDQWRSEQPLWLVENQALFDRHDWLPKGLAATLIFFEGYLDGRLLAWLAQQPRSPQVVFFSDYDGVGLVNFARLHALLGEQCEFWLMPNWQNKLQQYGNRKLWRKTLQQFRSSIEYLPPYLQPLTTQMQRSGLALEQEAVWLE